MFLNSSQFGDRSVEDFHQRTHSKGDAGSALTNRAGTQYHHLCGCDTRKTTQHNSSPVFGMAEVAGSDHNGGIPDDLAHCPDYRKGSCFVADQFKGKGGKFFAGNSFKVFFIPAIHIEG